MGLLRLAPLFRSLAPLLLAVSIGCLAGWCASEDARESTSKSATPVLEGKNTSGATETPIETQNDASTSVSPQRDATADEFMLMDEQSIGLVRAAQESLGLNYSELDIKSIAPLLGDLRRHVHSHYVLTKGTAAQHKPSYLFKRVMGKRSQERVVSTLKKLVPGLEDGEVVEQLDVMMQLLHSFHEKPNQDLKSIFRSVAAAVGFDLNDETVSEVQRHAGWVKPLLDRVVPQLSAFLSEGKTDEL